MTASVEVQLRPTCFQLDGFGCFSLSSECTYVCPFLSTYMSIHQSIFPPVFLLIFSPDSWQAIGVLTSQRWGLRWRTFEPAAPQGAVHGAVQTAVAKSGKGAVQGGVQGAEQGAVQSAVAKSGKGAVQGAMQGAVQTAVAKSGCCPECGGEVWQRYSAG